MNDLKRLQVTILKAEYEELINNLNDKINNQKFFYESKIKDLSKKISDLEQKKEYDRDRLQKRDWEFYAFISDLEEQFNKRIFILEQEIEEIRGNNND